MLKNLIVTGESQDSIDVVIGQKSLVLVQVNCTSHKSKSYIWSPCFCPSASHAHIYILINFQLVPERLGKATGLYELGIKEPRRGEKNASIVK